MRTKPTKELVDLIKRASAGPKRMLPPYFESTLTLRHPWWNGTIARAIFNLKAKDDNQLLDNVIDFPIPWGGDHYIDQREKLAFERDVDANPLKVPHRDVIKSLLSAVLNDRIYLQSLPSRALGRIRLESLNADWKRRLADRVANDPLAQWRGVNFAKWKKNKTWTRQQFVALVLGLDPNKLDENVVELSLPYSIIGNRVNQLLRRVDGATAGGEIRFPAQHTKLIDWARQQNGLVLPSQLLGANLRHKTKPVASALVDEIRKVVIEVCTEHDLTVYSPQLRALIDDIFGVDRLSENAFNKNIWRLVPKQFKAPGGQPPAPWLKAWQEDRSPIRDALKRIASKI